MRVMRQSPSAWYAYLVIGSRVFIIGNRHAAKIAIAVEVLDV